MKWTEEQHKAASKRAKARWDDPEYRAKNKGHTGSKHTDESKAKIGAAAERREFSGESKAKMSAAQVELWRDPKVRAKRIEGLLNQEYSPERVEKSIGRRTELYWADPERQARRKAAMQKLTQDPAYQEKMRQATKKAYAEGKMNNRTYSELELLIAPILESIGYRHTGDGGFFVRGEDATRCPDFKRRGKKQVLELFGDYWHLDDDPEETVAWYKEAGFACEVVWESDLPSFLHQYDPSIDVTWSRKQLRHYLRQV